MNRLKNKGFTLIELIAIVVVLAAIFLVSFPILLGITKNTKESKYDVTVGNLCEAGKTYIANNQNKYPNATSVGAKITIPVIELVEYGVVDQDTIDPALNLSLEDSTLIYTVKDDQSLSCVFEGKVTVPAPNDSYCNENLVYTGEVQSLLKRRIEGVIYTNDTAINAGTYTITALLDDASPYMWDDTTKGAKTFTCTIKKADDNITIVPVSVVYTNTTINPDISTTSGINTNKTFYSDSSCTTTSAAKNVGTYYVIATTTGNNNYNSVNSGCKIAGTITPAPLVPSANCQNKIYDGTRTATCTITVATVMQGDSLAATASSCLFDNANAGTNKTVTCTGITATGTGRSNYNLNPTIATTTATIEKQQVNPPRNLAIATTGVITWDPPSPNNATGYEISFDGSTYTGTTSGTNYFTTLTSSTGEKTVYVRAINSDTTNYKTPSSSISKKTNVYTLTVTATNGTISPTDNTAKVITGTSYSTSGQTLTVPQGSSSKTFTATKTDAAGYTTTFDKWSSTSGTITSNTTVTATYKRTPITYTISYDANGGTGAPSSHTYDYAPSGTTNLSSTTPSRTGYTFQGWSLSSTATSADYSAGQAWKLSNIPSSGTTWKLYAVWKIRTITISYNANGGTGAPSSHTYTYAASGTTNLSSTTPSRTGYTFQGWSLSSTATSADYSAGQAWALYNLPTSGDVYTLYAVWKVRTITISYNANGGTGAPSSHTYNYAASGTTNLSTTKPSRTGYTFLGWSLSSTATSASYSAGEAWALYNLPTSGNTYTLYAVWKIRTITISYNANGGSGAPSSHTYTYAASGTTNLSSATPTRTAFTFKGWSLSSTATSASYSAGQAWALYNLPTSGDTYTLYAVWESSERPTISCSVSGTSATGTGTRSNGISGYLVGATVTCTCSGTLAKPTSMTINGSTVSTTSSNGGKTITATKTISEPGIINTSAVCTNEGQAQSSTSTDDKYYYRPFSLYYNINGAEKIGNSSSSYNSTVQYLLANKTDDTYDKGTSYTLPTLYRTSSFAYCGSDCAALGWDLISTAKTARYNSGATIRMCTSGKSGCSDTDKGSNPLSSGTVALGAGYSARTVYGVSWGRIAAPKVFTGSGAFPASYFYLTGEAEELLGSGQTTTNLEVAASHRYEYAVAYNTRRYAWATIKPSCGWIDGGPDGTGSDWQATAHTGGTYLRYTSADGSIDKYVVNGDETTHASAVGDGNPPPLGKVPFIPTTYSNYTNYGWWCETHGEGWLVTPNANQGTYTCSKCEQGTGKLRMQYGSRDNNNIGVPTRTGYRFLGWYDRLDNNDPKPKMIYDSLGKAVKSGGYWNYPDYMQEYAIWVGLRNVNVYAHWEEMSATLTYYTNGHGSISGTNPVTMKYTEATYAKSAPSATGYKFLKWCTKSDGTGTCFAATGQHESVIKPANSTSYLSSNMSLYAIWEANTTTIKFDRRTDQYHAGATQPDDVTATYGKSVTAPYCASDCTGWYTSSGSSGVKVFNNDGTPTSNSTYFSSGKWSYTGSSPLKLYAKYN